jgi:hypothetical protein
MAMTEDLKTCYKCENSGHMRRDCWFKKPTKNNAAIGGHMMRDCSFKKPTKKKRDIISSLERQIEDEWDVKASFFIIYHKR